MQVHAEALSDHGVAIEALRRDLNGLAADVAALVEGETPVEPTPEPTPPPVVPEPTPPTSTEPSIAHWNLVPQQGVQSGFAVGVVAHHLDGVDRVDLFVDRELFASVDGPSVNPRTFCEEYWAYLPPGLNDTFTLGATVYSKTGPPTVVGGLNGETVVLHAQEEGDVVELSAGRHTFDKRTLPDKGWLTFRPAPGVAREDCIIEDRSKDWQDGRLKFENLTLNMPGGDGMIRGKWGTRNENQYFWADNCRIIGAGPSVMCKSPAKFWTASYFTDCELSDMQVVFDDAQMLTRNCDIHDIYEDVYRIPGLHVNINIRDVDRQPMIDAGADVPNPHPDILQAKALSRTIMQDVTAVDNIHGQGFYIKDGDINGVNGVALKRVNIQSVSPYTALHLFDETRNMLIEDSSFNKALLRGTIPSDARAVSRNSTVPDNWTGEVY